VELVARARLERIDRHGRIGQVAAAVLGDDHATGEKEDEEE